MNSRRLIIVEITVFREGGFLETLTCIVIVLIVRVIPFVNGREGAWKVKEGKILGNLKFLSWIIFLTKVTGHMKNLRFVEMSIFVMELSK